MIDFNKPCHAGKEKHYVYEAVNSDKLSGNYILIKHCPDFFEQRYGKQLMNRTKQTAIELGLKYIEVPTQYDNKQACSFYEACGFQIKSITNIYHFWL